MKSLEEWMKSNIMYDGKMYLDFYDCYRQTGIEEIECLPLDEHPNLDTIRIGQDYYDDGGKRRTEVKRVNFGPSSKLKYIRIDCYLEELDVSNLPELRMLDCESSNPKKWNLDLSNNKKLVFFNGGVSTMRKDYCEIERSVRIIDSLQYLEQEKEQLEAKNSQQKNLFNQTWNKKLELEKLKNKLINKESKEQTKLLTSLLEAQEQITRIKSENSGSRLVSLAEKQLNHAKEELKKEKISEEKLEVICRLQEEIIKLQIELGIEDKNEEYEARQEVPPHNNN